MDKPEGQINVSFKASMIAIAIATVVFSLVTYLAKRQMESYDNAITKIENKQGRQWQAIGSLQRNACAAHPQHCPQ